MKIDYIIPYVDGTDTQWVERFKTVKADTNVDEIMVRYAPNPLFRYVFRGIEKYMAFINNVILIVQSYSQVPKWINQNNIRIVTHDQFIPQEFLPTYNSATIECFLHRIPDLSPLFIYGNDDTYIVNNVSQDMFFEGYCPKNSLIIKKYDPDNSQFFHRFFNNVSNCALQSFDEICIPGEYLAPFHIQQAFSKAIYERIFNENEDMLKNSISTFRQENNINQYFFIIKYIKSTGTTFLKNDFKYRLIDIRNLPYIKNKDKIFDNIDFLCLNNNDNIHEYKLKSLFEEKFKNKSVFECK